MKLLHNSSDSPSELTSGPFERLPPHSADAEMCMLASMMLDKMMAGEIMQKVRSDDLFQADHRIIFDALRQMYERNQPVDAVLLRAELDKRGLLGEIGGVAYLATVLGTVPSAAHGMHYATIVREKSLLRHLITACTDSLRDAYGPQDETSIVLDRAERRIFEVAGLRVQGNATQSIETVLHEVWEQIENKGQRGIETGFYELDDMLNGLQPGEMIIVAARPSIGKTAFAMNIAEHVAGDNKLPVAVFSLEMSKQQLAQRTLCSRGNIDSHKLRKGMLQSHEYAHLANVLGDLAKAPIWIDDSPSLTVMDLRAKARRLKAEHDIKAFIVDYLQLMDNPDSESRQQGVTEISRGIKSIARELNIPAIVLSQLNRNSESREGHRPRMSDLRESGAIEQDADVIMLLHREDYYRRTEPNFVPDNIAEVIIAKQRNGPTGTVKLQFLDRSTRFVNASAAGADPF